MNRFVRVVVFVSLIMGAGGELAAQQIRSPYRFIDTSQYAGAFGGYLDARSGRIQLGPEGAATFGVRWGMRVSGPFSVEAGVEYLPSKRVVRDTAFSVSDSLYRALGETDMNILTVLGNVRFNITGPRTWRNLQPYLLFGAGAAIDLSGDTEIEQALPANVRFGFGTSFAGQLGIGVEWYASPRVSGRIDARSLFWKLNIPEAFLLTPRATTLERSEWERNLGLSAGLSFHF